MTAPFVFVTPPFNPIPMELYEGQEMRGILVAGQSRAYKKFGIPTSGTLWERLAEEKNFEAAK